MPFVGTERARKLDKREIMPETVGDLCCLSYKPMIEKFIANRSWTTAHRIKKDVSDGTWNRVFLLSRYETIPIHLLEETAIAVQLAWEVFFNLHVMQYEIEKFMENGSVTGKEEEEWII